MRIRLVGLVYFLKDEGFYVMVGVRIRKIFFYNEIFIYGDEGDFIIFRIVGMILILGGGLKEVGNINNMV